jgi:hypothetical protein
MTLSTRAALVGDPATSYSSVLWIMRKFPEQIILFIAHLFTASVSHACLFVT